MDTIANITKYIVKIQILVACKNVKAYGVVEFIICIGKLQPSIPNENNTIPSPTKIFIVYTINAKINDDNIFATTNLTFHT